MKSFQAFLKKNYWIIVGVFAVFFLGYCAAAKAAPLYDVNFSWTIPTQRTDGSPLALNEILSYEFYCTKGGTEVFRDTTINDVTNGTSSTSFANALDGPGTYTCYAHTIDYDNRKSAPSNPATKTIESDAPPNAPLNFDFTFSSGF